MNTVKITEGSFRNYYRDETSNPLSSNSKYFKFKTNITGNTYNVGDGKEGYDENKVGKNETEVVVPLKHLSIPLIHCEVDLILTLSKNCVLADMTVRAAQGRNPAIVAPTGLEFQITDKKLYVPVVTLSKENDIKLLEQLKTGFKRTIKWKKYRSQMTVQLQNSNLNYLIEPTFTNVNILFVLSFARDNAGDNRDPFSDYYVPNIEIKYFKILIDGKSFFDLPVKNEEEAYNMSIDIYLILIDMSNNNDYTTGKPLDFACFKENYKLIAINLSKQN